MTSVILFIRQHGVEDVADIHSSEAAATAALINHVRENWSRTDMECPSNDGEAIEAFFADDRGLYAIVEARRFQ